ncbi:MAG: XdhC family protein [Acidobacteriaceae bacterium]
MGEQRSILGLWRSRENASTLPGAPSALADAFCVLVTLVRLEGSSYRKPGARLLVCGDAHAGSISGGCLEGEILRKAAWIARSGAAIQRYSTYYDDANEMPYGLGCGGAMDLLFEPLHLPETQALLHALERSLAGERMLAATLLPAGATGAPLRRVVLHADGGLFFASASLDAEGRGRLMEAASGAAKGLLAGNAPTNATVSVEMDGAMQTAFVESTRPPQRLVLFGAGDDARPLVRMAYLLGWRVVVADGRPDLARPDRFPEAELVLPLSPTPSQQVEALAGLHLASEDAAVLLTHSYEQDRTLLPQLLPLDLRYLGLMGSRPRSRLLLLESATQLGWTPEQCLERVHAPVGLDLGGDQPEEVALAIVAEVQAALHRRELPERRAAKRALLDPPATPYVPAACPQDVFPGSAMTHTEAHEKDAVEDGF